MLVAGEYEECEPVICLGRIEADGGDFHVVTVAVRNWRHNAIYDTNENVCIFESFVDFGRGYG